VINDGRDLNYLLSGNLLCGTEFILEQAMKARRFEEV
jgi:hypothetical protein